MAKPLAADYDSYSIDSVSVEQHFASPYSTDVYTQDTLEGALHRERRRAVLGFVDQLRLPLGTQALEVGCGAGQTSIALAQRGHYVHAIDKVDTMVGLTQRAVRKERLGDRIETRVGDVHRLGFHADTFDLALAIGVMAPSPTWVPFEMDALCELHRVLKPGGYLIASVENAWAMRCLIDPLLNPAVQSAKRMFPGAAGPSRCSSKHFDRTIAAAGFDKFAGHSVGFGPFTLFGVPLLRDAASVRLHHKLQFMADNRNAMLRHFGETYLVLARKPAA